MKSAAELRRDVVDEPAHGRVAHAARIEASIHPCAADPGGSGATPAGREFAERPAEHVCGVREGENETGAATHPARTDAGLADAVARALAWDLWVPHQRLRVTVRDGRVTLEGEVDSRFQKEAAVLDVSRLPGVRGIIDLQTILPTPDVTEVDTRIVRALGADALPREVRVETFPGAVMLRGIVRSREERDGAGRAAWSVPGVREVWNRLEVRDPETTATQRRSADGTGRAPPRRN